METNFWSSKTVLLTGGNGFIGKNLSISLKKLNATVITFSREEYDLRKEESVNDLLNKTKPNVVFHLASDHGGLGYIKNNQDSIYYNNILMNTILLDSCAKKNIQKVVCLNTVNAYPETAPTPLNEEDIFQGAPHPNIISYGLTKRLMITQSKILKETKSLNSINLVLENTFGEFDTFEEGKSRVIPANILRFYDAKEKDLPFVEVWGTGKSTRDFVYVQDAIQMILAATENYNSAEPLNISSGSRITIKELVTKISEIIGYKGEIKWDHTKPDGKLKRYLDVSKAKNLGIKSTISIEEGLKRSIAWFLKNN